MFPNYESNEYVKGAVKENIQMLNNLSLNDYEFLVKNSYTDDTTCGGEKLLDYYIEQLPKLSEIGG